MLLIDGVKYQLGTPTNEDEFETLVREHASEIFGENAIYFDRKQKLKSLAGIGSIPDGYLVTFGNSPEWHIIEIELSSHPIHEHVVSQVSKFVNGVRNPATQNEIAGALYREITADDFLKLKMRKAIGSDEIYKFLSDVIGKSPTITVIIERRTTELDEALNAISHPHKKVVEFQTFRRVGAEAVHAYLFEPVYPPCMRNGEMERQTSRTAAVLRDWETRRAGTTKTDTTIEPPSPGDELEVIIGSYFISYHLFRFPKGKRQFFPGYCVPFVLETNVGEITTYVTSAKKGTQYGDPNAGLNVYSGLADWYRRNSLKVGDKVVFTLIEPMKRYRLDIVKP